VNVLKMMQIYLIAGALNLILPIAPAQADVPAVRPTPLRDGRHDFDFAFGRWKTHISRLVHPLTGSTNWVEYDDTAPVRAPCLSPSPPPPH
jgi:hypothetical protein